MYYVQTHFSIFQANEELKFSKPHFRPDTSEELLFELIVFKKFEDFQLLGIGPMV